MPQLKWSLAFFSCCFLVFALSAQSERWQQEIEYEMNFNLDVRNHKFKGNQKITYKNNSPESLDKVFFHLYFNAFQPGSMMDVRNRQLPDPDQRVAGRIPILKENEIGLQRVTKLSKDGIPLKFEHSGTILEVKLNQPIGPGEETVFDMDFEGQVPIQIRRSGRNNREKVDYSMTQWYPKMCEYDYQGWHANPYVGREFHGVWGNFDVKITIDKSYVIGGTGILQNAEEIGHGYTTETVDISDKKTLTWHFKAEKVHDFAWGADPEFIHDVVNVPDGPVLHFFYRNEETLKPNWKKLQKRSIEVFQKIGEFFGEYPYPAYSIIQGGDGGMEYPMCTLITGERNFPSLLGVTIHEVMHSWFQGIMATNESLYSWMDEGFTSWASTFISNEIAIKKKDNPFEQSYKSYVYLTKSGKEEALSTHADHFETNFAYGMAAYTKGEVFLQQLGYIIGEKNLMSGLKSYYDKWKFKHPNPNDFIRVMELESGLELDWYKEYWVNSTKTIDYGIETIEKYGKSTLVKLKRVGKMPMPIDLSITYKDGRQEIIHIPLSIMRGAKSQEDPYKEYEVVPDWYWTHIDYEITLPLNIRRIASIEIDASGRLADVDRTNNMVDLTKSK